MIAWLRRLLRRWLLEATDEQCFRDFTFATHNGVPITAQCRRPAGHSGPCDM